MKPAEFTDDDRMTAYLLGTCPEEERALLEARFFADDEFFDRLRAVEAELIDAYLGGHLNREDKILFERQFGTSPRKKRVDFGRAFRSALPGRHNLMRAASARLLDSLRAVPRLLRPSPALVFALAGLVLAAGLYAFWTARQTRDLRALADDLRAGKAASDLLAGRLQQQVAELETNRRTKPEPDRPAAAAPPGTPKKPLPFVTFVLSAGLLRGTDEPVRLVIPANALEVRLQLDLEESADYGSYRAELRTAGGNLLWSRDMLRPRNTDWGRAVDFAIPAEILRPGEHELALRGLVTRGRFEDTGYYYFSVLRR